MAFMVRHDLTNTSTVEVPVLAVLERVVPQSVLQAVVSHHTHRPTRRRKLPGEVLMALLIAWYLVPGAALETVLATLLLGPRLATEHQAQPAGRSGIAHARKRWGVSPMIDLFRTVCRPLAPPTLQGAFCFGLRTMAIDSSHEDVADTPANEAAFGRHRSQHGMSAFPQLVGVYLVECGTRAIIGASFWPCHTSVHRAVRRLLPQIETGMLVLWDTGFHSYALAVGVRQRGAHFLSRVPAGQTFILHQRLPDGSYLARFSAAPPSRRSDTTASCQVRLVVYTITDPARPGYRKQHRLMTSLLDPVRAPATELIAAYHERWEIEVALDEVDTHLRLAPGPLRSQTPRGIIQEAYGMLLAHYAVRAVLAETALRTGLDPDRLSFVHAVRLIVLYLPVVSLVPLASRAALYQHLLADVQQYRLPPRAHRQNPRAVKRPWSKHRLRPTGTTDRRHRLRPFAETVELLPQEVHPPCAA